MTHSIIEQILQLDDKDKKTIQRYLNNLTPHPLEKLWNTDSTFILDAIERSQDITKRGVKGIIAELAFSTNVLGDMKDWTQENINGDLPYDFKIKNASKEVRIQTKNQRLQKGIPLNPNSKIVKLNPHVEQWYIAETQKTRSGLKKTDNKEEATRPYRFSEFDILAVCMQPSTSHWNNFMFAPAPTLIPSAKNTDLIATYQPVPPFGKSQYNWTPDLKECIDWILNHDNLICPLKY